MAIDYDKYAERMKAVAVQKRSPIDDAILSKIKGDQFTLKRGADVYNKQLQVSQKYGLAPPAEPTPESLEQMGKDTMHAKPLAAVGDVVKGALTRAIPDAAAAVAMTIDDPYTTGGLFDQFIDNRKKAQQEYINAPGGDDIAIPFTTITRKEMREGVSSLGFSAAAWVAAKLGGTAAGAAVGTMTGIPLAGTAAGAVIGFIGSAGAAGAMAYKMDKNAFVREYRSFLEQKENRKITDEEFAQYRSGQVADLLAEHGLHEAGWEGIFTAIEQGTLARLGGGLPAKALKGLASLALFEIGSEAGTQIGQTNVETKLGMADEMRSYLSPQDWLTSAREVLPAILTMSGTMAMVETTAGAIGDKIKEGRLNELNQFDLPTLDALANDPAAMKERGVTQADVVTVMQAKARQDVLTDLKERDYTPKEFEEIKKDKELLAAVGATEYDITEIQDEVQQEIDIAKQAANVDPRQEELKKLNNQLVNLAKLPGADPVKIEEVTSQRDALIEDGVQEPEGLYRMDRPDDIVRRRENLLSRPEGVGPDMDQVGQVQDDLVTYLSGISTRQRKPDDQTGVAIDALISRPELIKPENKEYVLGYAMDAAKLIGRDTKDIEALMPKPLTTTQSALKLMLEESESTETRGVAYDEEGNRSSVAASSPAWFDTLREIVKKEGHGEPQFRRPEIKRLIEGHLGIGKPLNERQAIRLGYILQASEKDVIGKHPDLVAAENINDLEKEGYEIKGGKVPVGDLKVGDKFYGSVSGKPGQHDFTVTKETGAGVELQNGGKTTVDMFDEVDVVGILSAAGGMKAMRGFKNKAPELRKQLQQVLGTPTADHATLVNALVKKAGVKNPAELDKTIANYKPPVAPVQKEVIAPVQKPVEIAESVKQEQVKAEPAPKTELELIDEEGDNLVARERLENISVADKAQADVVEQKIKDVDTRVAESMRGTTIKMDVVAEGTKNTTSVEVDASEAYMENREQDELCKKLLNCLGA